MPRNMVHPRLKRILSESSSAVSSPPDTPSDPGKAEPESEEQDPEVEPLFHSNQKRLDVKKAVSTTGTGESSGSKMDMSDEDAGARAPEVEDKVSAVDADASSDTQKPADSPKKTQSSRSSTPLPPVNSGSSGSAEPSIARDDSPQPPAGHSKSISRSSSVHSTKDFKYTSTAPPSTSVSANRSPAPQLRPSLKIKLKLGTRSSNAVSEADAGDDVSSGGRTRPKGSGRGNAKGKGKEKESMSRSLTFTIPPRPRTDPSEASTRASISRSQSSEQSSVESEDDPEGVDADESEDENEAHPGLDDQNGLREDVMDVDNVPSLRDRLVDYEDSEGDGEIPDDEMDDGGGDDDSEVLPGDGKGRLTARQAVLASMVGADHVELEPSTSSRKKQLTSEEIALRREETARKRKNMSEKKLEDEKTETINRLLKKQSSRSRAKRSALLNSSVVPTPQSPHSGDEGESDAVLGAVPGTTEQKTTTLPGPAWRWVSNSTGIRLGVPREVVDIGVAKVDIAHDPGPAEGPAKPKPPATCNVLGCGARRKYRLVHDFERGACGMEHLRVLTNTA